MKLRVYFCTCIHAYYAAFNTGLENIDATKCEAQALRMEVKNCTEQVQKLSKEFEEIKMDVQAALKEVDGARCALAEITVKLLSSN